MSRLRGRAALIDYHHRLASQRPGYIALQILFCLPLLPAFLVVITESSPFLDFILDEIPTARASIIFGCSMLVLLVAWLIILAWQERRWEESYCASAKKMLKENSLLLFILEPEYVDTLAPLSHHVSQAAGEQRKAYSLVSRIRHFLRHYSRYQLALFIWREKYAPQPDWRDSIWLFTKLAGLAAIAFLIFVVFIGFGALYLPYLAVFPLIGLMLLKRQARNIGLSLAIFEELTGGVAEKRA